MYCTISRFRGAVSFNQVPYPAGTVSASSFCRRPPPWSRLLLALARGLSLTLPHNPGAPPLQEKKRALMNDRAAAESALARPLNTLPGSVLYAPHSMLAH